MNITLILTVSHRRLTVRGGGPQNNTPTRNPEFFSAIRISTGAGVVVVSRQELAKNARFANFPPPVVITLTQCPLTGAYPHWTQEPSHHTSCPQTHTNTHS